jgi:membrane fusion protein, epimerase transport system
MVASLSEVDLNAPDAANEDEAQAAPRSSQQHATHLSRFGWGIILFAIVPIVAWMALAPLSMAVVAPALIKVDLNRRPVQHLEGGIVREVLVRNGQVVKAGDPILVLGNVGVDADRNRLLYRVQVERAALVRLDAEQLRAEKLTIPSELDQAAHNDERIKQALLKETSLFEAGRNSLNSEIAIMKIQRESVAQEIVALKAQIAQSENSLGLQRSVYQANSRLVKGGFISTTRMAELEASVADYGSKLEQQRSELARARQRSADIDLKIKSVENAYVRTASDQLKDTSSRLAEIEQELRKSTDAAARQVVVAPASGEVIDLKFNSAGAVVRAGEPIADIVPSDAKLMVEARIRPEDINNVQRDQPARVKLTSFKYRKSSMVNGKVTYVSADRLVDRDVAYYSVMIAADENSLHTAGDLKLHAGMPAEVYIEGTKQTTLQYLIEPLTTTIRKAGRQM